MHRAVFLIGALSLLFAAGCADESPTSAGSGEPAPKLTVSAAAAGAPSARATSARRAKHELRFDQTLSPGELEIDWLDVGDSRCAEGVTCVWEGQVTIAIGVRQGSGDLGRFELTLHPGDEDQARVAAGDYLIRLLGVEPYPRADVETRRSEYVAILTVARAADEERLAVSEARAGGYRQRRARPMTRGEDDRTFVPAFADREWKLETLGEDAPIPDTEITIRFDGDGQAQGSAGCNSYFGGYEAEAGGALSIGALGVTEMFCGSPEGVMAQETRFLGSLAGIVRAAVEQDRLTLFSAGGQAAIRFIAADDAPSVEVTDLIDRQWNLQSFETVGEDRVSLQPVLAGSETTIQFIAAGRVEGSGGCNSYFGGYETGEDGALRIRELGYTEMACLSPEGIMAQETRFFSGLSRVGSFQIGESSLKLVSSDGQEVFHFAAD